MRWQMSLDCGINTSTRLPKTIGELEEIKRKLELVLFEQFGRVLPVIFNTDRPFIDDGTLYKVGIEVECVMLTPDHDHFEMVKGIEAREMEEIRRGNQQVEADLMRQLEKDSGAI